MKPLIAITNKLLIAATFALLIADYMAGVSQIRLWWLVPPAIALVLDMASDRIGRDASFEEQKNV